MHHFDDIAERATTACLDYALERLRDDPAPLDRSVPYDELARAAGQNITAAGRAPEEVLRVFKEVLARACLSTDSPRFLAFIPAAPTKAALVFDTVVGASSMCATSWLEASGAVYAENEALRYVADLAGMGPEAGGCFVSGGSAGNLSALVAARDTAARARGSRPDRWRVAVGEESHSSIQSALRVIDCDPLVIPSGPADRMTGDSLRAVLNSDPDPSSICAVAATAGTTNAGIIDDLAGLSAVARDRDIWFHVDAAYGGAAMAAPSVRDRFAGIAAADSLVVDPHKWLFAPFDSCALLYREPELAQAVHAQHASYLEPMRLAGEWNPADYAYHLSRRARGLPFWYSLAVYGTDAYAAAIEQVLGTTQAAARRIDEVDHVSLIRDPELSVVLFRRPGWSDADYFEWSQCLLREQVAFILPTSWRGEIVARAVFLNPNTTLEIFDEVLETMR
ncbi:MAG: aspartate aminotransferase family protein [Actinobacteria bacterium]|nr:aspartate aminotransferase family protein [Actinomycetota bacterium]